MPRYRWVLWAATFACLLASVLLSASCGCGGGKSSITSPTTDNTYKPDYPSKTYYRSDDPWRWTNDISKCRDDKWSRKLYCELPARAMLLRERWIAAAGYLMEAEHRNVTAGAVDTPTDWRSLVMKPRCSRDCLPDNFGAASVIYAISTDTLGDNEVYLELTWESEPRDPDTCWVAVHLPGEGDEAWNWFKPGEEMRVALTPVAQYRHDTLDEKVYIAVALTGTDSAVLRKVALCEYQAEMVRRRVPCRDRYTYEDKYRCPSDRDRTYHGDYYDDHHWVDHPRDSYRCDDYRYDTKYEEPAPNALLVLEPHGAPGDPPDAPGVAEVLYTFKTDDLDGDEIYIGLDWARAPLASDCWVGVFRPRSGSEAWNWFKPGEEMRVALNPVTQYKSSTKDELVYIKVVVTGTRSATLAMVELSEYDFDFIR